MSDDRRPVEASFLKAFLSKIFLRRRARPKKKKTLLHETVTLLGALLFALVIRSFLMEPFTIPSGSMKPTLLVGDFIFVSKYTYGYSKYSFPFALFPFSGRFFFSPPQRGDIVVFRKPTDTSIDYIKRLIGLPGDTVQVREGRLYINGHIVPRTETERFMFDAPPFRGRPVMQYDEHLPGGYVHRLIEIQGDRGFLDNTSTFHVPPGHYFMMGDNRDNSSDSRVMTEVGFVPVDNLIGRARFIWLSLDSSFRWYNPLTWLTSIRYRRLFHVLH